MKKLHIPLPVLDRDDRPAYLPTPDGFSIKPCWISGHTRYWLSGKAGDPAEARAWECNICHPPVGDREIKSIQEIRQEISTGIEINGFVREKQL